MIYDDPTNLQGLLQWMRNRVKADANKLPEKIARLYMNAALDRYIQLVMFASGLWKFDDSSHPDYGIITTNIVASQQDYALNNSILTIRRVEMKDENDNWTQLTTTEALPNRYYLQDGALWLLPVPNTNITSGLKIYYDRVMNYFDGTASQEPGVPKHLHRWIGEYAALLFAEQEGLPTETRLRERVSEGEKAIQNHISRRNYGKNPRIKVRSTPSY